MINNADKDWAVSMLCNKFAELGRLPKKDDFDDATRSRIKAYLGPWPRALESAGLKQASSRSNNRKQSVDNERKRQ